MIRVCHVGKYYPPAAGGIETHIQTLGHAQSRLGADVSVFCFQHEFGIRPLTRSEVETRAGSRVRIRRIARWASLFRFDVSPGLVGSLQRAIDDADVVHVHTPNPAVILAMALSRTRRVLVVGHQSDIVRQKALNRLMRPFEDAVYGRAARILANSPLYPAGSEILTRFRDRVTVLPLGIDLEQFLTPSAAVRNHAERYRASYGSPLWVLVGRLVYYKGIPVALRALQQVPGRLMIVGAGPLECELRKLAASLSVDSRVIWAGKVSGEELAGAYHAATAFWFPSNARSEAFGLVQVEAMASGCPVINTMIPHSGVSWVSPHDVSGLTVPPDDAGAFAGAVRRILQEPGLRERLSRGARDRARAEFDDRLMAERSLRIYREVCSR